SDEEDASFAPEPITQLYQRSLYHSIRRMAGHSIQQLKAHASDIPAAAQVDAARLIEQERGMIACLRSLVDRRIQGSRLRCHGDYHLGQVLFTGNDFVVIDFEGDSARPLSERRIKRSPLLDVATMLRSYDYVASQACARLVESMVLSSDDQRALESAAHAWYRWVGAALLRSYLEATSAASFLPGGHDELRGLLHALLVEKVSYEIAYELNHRPKWVGIPIKGMLEILDSAQCGKG
ncbi:MAG TPA: phosphotransferase, partial [Pirellulales bacterium]|nr:phosphotransferase [Pirellulales bacterium]